MRALERSRERCGFLAYIVDGGGWKLALLWSGVAIATMAWGN